MRSAGRRTTACPTASPTTSGSTRAASRSPAPPPPGSAPWKPFSRRLFQALFVDGASPLDDDVCVRLARTWASIRPASAVPSNEPETAADLAATVEEAVARGVFGVPSFVLGDEVYFGNDRLVLLRHALLKTRVT